MQTFRIRYCFSCPILLWDRILREGRRQAPQFATYHRKPWTRLGLGIYSAACSTMNSFESAALVRTCAVHLPPIAGRLLAVYLDCCPSAPFCSGLFWCDQWRGCFGMVRVFGADAAGLRFRLVIESAKPRIGFAA